MKKRQVLIKLFITMLFVSLLLLTACSEKTTEVDYTPTADRDAATAIAANVAYQTGGTVDQIADLSSFLTPNGMENLNQKYSANTHTITKTYNETTGVWDIHIVRERGTVGSVPYAYMVRNYTLQYLNAAGVPQMHYVEAADTARTVLFNVVDGYGRHVTHRLSQTLSTLTAHWTVTNANQSYVTVNGDYYRAAVDTLSNPHHVRVSDHWLQLDINDVVAPRGEHESFAGAISGSVTGHYHASVTFTTGTGYTERIIDRDINILFGDGRAVIDVNGEAYRSNLDTGEMIN